MFVETARSALEGTKINVAAVSTGFPAGLSPFEDRVSEIRRSVSAGAQEIDVVITRAHVSGLSGKNSTTKSLRSRTRVGQRTSK